MSKTKSGLFAGFISLFIPGIGHFYLARASRGIRLALLYLAAPLVLATLLRLSDHVKIYYGYLLVIVLLWLSIAIDAVIIGYKSGKTEMKPYNRWYFYLLFIASSLLISYGQLKCRDVLYGYGTYHIPSTSMSPTLRPGDYILTDSRAYSREKPHLGDVVVFLVSDGSGADYVKRIVGLPGDEVRIKAGITYVNGKELPGFIPDYYEWQMPMSLEFGPVKIPEGQYFVLGDNRDNSQDSREFGPILLHDILGKVTYIWMAAQSNRAGLKVN